MRKIPTLFERDWDGDRSRVVDQVVPGCEWVIEGEGVATRKMDGTCAMIRDGKLYKRHEVKQGKQAPVDFDAIPGGYDSETGKTVGWIPVGDGPEDRWHREAFARMAVVLDGTYELLGPKVQGNPEGFEKHTLVLHTTMPTRESAPRTFDGLRDYFTQHDDIEGLVWHHPDGRMAKIKARDFGIRRRVPNSHPQGDE